MAASAAPRSSPHEVWVSRALSDPLITNNFHVKELIGHGTFGRVWKVRTGEETFALKAFKPFVDFTRIASEIRIVRDYGRGEENCIIQMSSFVLSPPDTDGFRNAFLLTPHVPFVKFKELIRRGLTPRLILEFMRGLLRALEFLHSHGVIHRDIKPSNFLCDPVNLVFRLIDFGLAEVKSLKKIASRDPRDIAERERQVEANSTSSRKKKAQEMERERSCPTPEAGGPSPKKRAEGVRGRLFSTPTPDKDATTPAELPDKPRAVVPNFAQRRRQSLALRRASKGRPLSETRRPPASGKAEAPPCPCFALPSMPCAKCGLKEEADVNLNGTAGFRAPEMLLRWADQGPPVDVWAAGMVGLCLVAETYPLFAPKDHAQALAQVLLLEGTRKMEAAAASLRKAFRASSDLPGVDYRNFAFRLRNGAALEAMLGPPCQPCGRAAAEAGMGGPGLCLCAAADGEARERRLQRGLKDPLAGVPEPFFRLLGGMLEPDFRQRLTATVALQDHLLPMLEKLTD